jgi:hypothetical protein
MVVYEMLIIGSSSGVTTVEQAAVRVSSHGLSCEGISLRSFEMATSIASAPCSSGMAAHVALYQISA